MGSVGKPVVVVGSINVDFVVTARRIPVVGETLTGSDFQTHFGGKGANQAVAVARLGYPVEMIGMVGSDVFGPQVKESLEKAGVGTRAIEVADGSSGIATITVSYSGENAIVVVPGANAQVSPSYLDRHEDAIRDAGVVLAQLEVPTETVSYLAEMCARHEVPLILDPAPALELPPEIFSKIAWFTPNETECDLYAGRDRHDPAALAPERTAAAILAKGCGGVVLKLGAAGAYVASHDGLGQMIPAFPVDAVDSTAAGDAFNGGFATGLMMGKSAEESAFFASAVAALSVTRTGAQSSMPTMDEVARFMASAGFRK